MAYPNLIDPNAIISSNIPNGTPEYERMFIFVELKAARRGASVLTSTGNESGRIENTFEETTISMLGYDQERNEYSTRYTEAYNSDENKKLYEGFGITDINIKINASYVPQVIIEFTDVKGLSLFNVQENSPYNVLFSFPYPIFNLTIKGYYGRPLELPLHLLKTHTTFDGSNGNYIIRGEFVGLTYAPLADILFAYARISPYMDENVNTETLSNEEEPPRSINELIKRGKKLYNDIAEFKNEADEIKEINDAEDKINRINDVINYVNNLNEFAIDENENFLSGRLKLGIITELEETFIPFDEDTNPLVPQLRATNIDRREITEITNLSGFDQAKNAQNNIIEPNNKKERLIIYIRESGGNSESSLISQKLEEIREVLLSRSENFNVISRTDIKINNVYTEELSLSSPYQSIDITNFYIKIIDYRNDLSREKETYSSFVLNEINSMVYRTLRAKPTIRFIFEIIMNDVDRFFRILRETSSSAENHHEEFKNQIISRFKNTIKKTSQNNQGLKIYPWPLYTKIDDNNLREQKAYVGDDFNFLDEPFPEATFVDRFINGFIREEAARALEELKRQKDGEGNVLWIPINPLDAEISQTNTSESPFIGLLRPEDIYNLIIDRYYIASQFTYKNYFQEKSFLTDFWTSLDLGFINTEDLILFTAKAEANNLINSINNLNLLESLKTGIQSIRRNDSRIIELISKNPKYNTAPESLTIENVSIFASRLNEEFQGFEILDEESIELRNSTSDDLVSRFLQQDNAKWLEKFSGLIFGNRVEKFSKDNLVFIRDERLYNSKNDESDFFGFKSLGENLKLQIEEEGNRSMNRVINNFNGDPYIKMHYIVSLIRQDGGNYLYNTRNFFDDGVYKKFTLPAIIEMPNISLLFMGSLVYHLNDENSTQYQNYLDLFEYLDADGLNNPQLSRAGTEAVFRTSRIPEKLRFLSQKDKETLINYFVGFTNDYYNIIEREINDNILVNADNEDELLNSIEQSRLVNILIDSKYILNYTSITFFNFPSLRSERFRPISELSENILLLYFKTFFNEFNRIVDSKLERTRNERLRFLNSIDDEDIKNRCYYSFKSIHDKWIAGYNDPNSGFPFSEGRPLIDSFIFVDRAFRDIGDNCVINFQPLLDASEDFDSSIFSVIAQMLSYNGFEFFPLPSFMSFEDGEWREVFEITEDTTKPTRRAFVCMYIGGASSQLNDAKSDYADDGFSFNGDNYPQDFSNSDVKAFKVKFGQQNQSLFRKIALDTMTYEETNESLQILSEIAGDDSQSAPIPKGQNLFNIFERRSYTCEVEMFGNAMIQPTQYFELENVPMFNGAYIILDTEHKITPNNMTTNFKGLRIAKYPNPIVNDFATIVGLNEGTSNDISGSDVSPQDLEGLGITNEMTTLKLKL
ncbi:MAG: hypothetical protein ACOC33_02255 [bacterium]